MPASLPDIRFYDAAATATPRRLAARVWPTKKRRPTHVVFLHGIKSHSDWYAASAEYLAAAGFYVHFPDRRGSGLNAEQRGDVDRWQTWLADVERYLELLHDKRPLVLCGISWGGKLAAAVARYRPDLVDGLGLFCPGLFARQQPGVLRRSLLAAARFGRLQTARLTIPLEDPRLFTNSPAWQAYVRDDPLTLREVTLRFARADQQLTRYARQAAPFLQAPTLLMLGGQDRIVANDPTRRYLGRIAAARKTLIEYPNAAHTLEFEPDPQPYFEDLVAWLHKLTQTSRYGC